MSEEISHVRVTINDLYKEQQETNKLLIQLASELKNLSDLPDRVSKIEIEQAKNAWVGKFVWGAMTAGVSGFILALWQVLHK